MQRQGLRRQRATGSEPCPSGTLSGAEGSAMWVTDTGNLAVVNGGSSITEYERVPGILTNFVVDALHPRRGWIQQTWQVKSAHQTAEADGFWHGDIYASFTAVTSTNGTVGDGTQTTIRNLVDPVTSVAADREITLNVVAADPEHPESLVVRFGDSSAGVNYARLAITRWETVTPPNASLPKQRHIEMTVTELTPGTTLNSDGVPTSFVDGDAVVISPNVKPRLGHHGLLWRYAPAYHKLRELGADASYTRSDETPTRAWEGADQAVAGDWSLHLEEDVDPHDKDVVTVVVSRVASDGTKERVESVRVMGVHCERDGGLAWCELGATQPTADTLAAPQTTTGLAGPDVVQGLRRQRAVIAGFAEELESTLGSAMLGVLLEGEATCEPGRCTDDDVSALVAWNPTTNAFVLKRENGLTSTFTVA
jgi:hypothetical protein